MTEAGQNEAQQSIIQLRKDIAGLLRGLVARCGGYTRTQEPAIREYAALISDLPALRQRDSQLVAAQEERKFLKELVEMVASNPGNSHYHAANELLKTFNKEEHSMSQPPSPSDVPTSERGEGDCIAAVARALCVADGYDPEELEPGDALGIDGRNRKGEPCHFMWKHYIEKAEAAIAAMPKPESVAQTPPTPKQDDERGEEVGQMLKEAQEKVRPIIERERDAENLQGLGKFHIGGNSPPTPKQGDVPEERTTFNEWFLDYHGYKPALSFDAGHRHQWAAWQARAAIASYRAAEPEGMTEEQWKKHATQKSLDIVESFYNILKARDARIAELEAAEPGVGKPNPVTTCQCPECAAIRKAHGT